MESVRLALQGLRWRSGASLAVFLVGVVAMAGSALGPLYAHSAGDSLVRESLATAAPVTTGVEVRGAVAGQTQFTPGEILEVVDEQAHDPGLDPWFGSPTLAMVVRNGAPFRDGDILGLAEIGWHQGQCETLTIVDGRCPAAPGEAMVSSRTVAEGRVALGDEVRLGISADAAADTVAIVGTYDVLSADPAVWGLGSPDQARAGSAKGEPDRIDEVLVDRSTLEASRGDVTSLSFRPLDAQTVHVADLPALTGAVLAATDNAAQVGTDGPRTVATSGLPVFLEELEPVRSGVAAAAFAVSIQLVLLSWFVLFLIVSAMSDERAGEIALAKLRGMSRRSTVSFGLAEPVLLLLLAVPVGLAVAYVANLVLTSRYLAPGSEVMLTPLAIGALVLCLLGGVAAAALAARGILTAPVLSQLRRTGGRRARLARSAAVDAIAVALAIAGVYSLMRGQSDVLALLAPGLIALAVGLLAARAMPVLARTSVARSRYSPKVATFLASRNIARRPAGLRILVLLSLAVGLAVFAVDGSAVAAGNRVDQARALVGATTVLQVRAASPGDLLAAVEAVDPQGTQAMAAVTVNNGQGGLLAVDSARLDQVALWDPAWIGLSMADTMAWLRPPVASETVSVRDRLTVDTSLVRQEGGASLGLGVVVRDSTGRPAEIAMGDLPDGEASASAALPMCRETECTLLGFTVRQPIDRPSSPVRAMLDLGPATDAEGAVDLGRSGPGGWRSGITTTIVPVEGGAEVVGASDGTISIQIDVERGDAAVEVADRPAALPTLHGTDYDTSAGSTRVAGLDGRFVDSVAGGFGLLPRLASAGSMADLRLALAATSGPSTGLTYQVWLAPDAPESVRAALEQQGVAILGEESVDDRLEVLGRSGEALALRLFVITALVALGLAAGTLLAYSFIMIRRRAYELAALKALGATTGLLVRSGRRELLVLVTSGVVLGAVSGLVAASAALPALLAGTGIDGPPPWYGPAWTPVLLLLGATLVLLGVIADLSARSTARRATPDLLRQVQE